MEESALAGVKVLDFGWALVGSITGKLLGDHGAQVIKVESHDRLDFLRADRFLSISTDDPDTKPLFAYQNTSKYSITLDLKHPQSIKVIDRLIRWADVVNENFTPGTLDKLGIGYEYISKIKPDIIMLGASLYGQTGPLSHEWGVDMTGAAASGHLYLTGWPDRIPSTSVYGDLALPLINALAIVAALDYKRRTGKGQYIDTSMLEILANKTSPALLDFEINGHLQTRSGNRIPHAAPHGVFPCKGDDRWCVIAVFTDDEWTAFCHVLGDPPWTKEQKFSTFKDRKNNEDELEKQVGDWTCRYSAEHVMKVMQAAGLAAGIVQTAEDLMEHDPQFKARGCLIPMKHTKLGSFGHPTPPFKLSKTRAQVKVSPCLGEHTEYICTQLLGLTDEEFVDLLQEGVFN